MSALVDFPAFWRATKDAFGLAYMKGGGAGCNYPGENFSRSRMWFHHLTFYGFLLDFAATSIAAFYDHFLGWQAPYPYFSAPVVFGTVGGIGLLIGPAGLLYLKWKSDRIPADSTMLNMDVAFLVLLFVTSFTGLLLLGFRETSAMGMLLVIHLALGVPRSIHYCALWQIRPRGLPLRSIGAILHRAAKGRGIIWGSLI